MDKYVCTLCGYVYDPILGDPGSNIEPGTPFESLPDDWVCLIWQDFSGQIITQLFDDSPHKLQDLSIL